MKDNYTYSKVIPHVQGKVAPTGFRIADKCCINCIHCYDDSTTACMKHDWFSIEWFNICDDFDGGIF